MNFSSRWNIMGAEVHILYFSVSELGFNDPATLEGYEGQLMISWKVDKIGSKNNDYVESRQKWFKTNMSAVDKNRSNVQYQG